MSKMILIFAGSLALAVQGFSQAVMTENMRAATTLDRLGNFHGNNLPDMLYGIPMPPGKVVGDSYLNEDWRVATVFLYGDNKTIEGYPTRYDIATNELEFNARNGIKVLSGDKVRNFVWIDGQTNAPGYFVNAKEFKTADNVPVIGFFQVLSDGKMPLLKRTKIIRKKADYNAALNVGSIDEKILKSEALYYSKEYRIFKIPSSNKKVISLFGDRSADIKKFIDDNSLSAGKENDLIKIFDHYNEIAKN